MDKTRREFLYGMGVAFTSSIAGCSKQQVNNKLPTNQFRSNLKNTGYIGVNVPDTVILDWSIPTNTGDHTASKGSPIITSNDNILIADDTGRIRLITPEGEILWSTSFTDSERGSHGTPAIADGRAYIGAYDGAVSAINLDDGEIVWQKPLGSAIGASPTYYDNKLYIAVEYSDPSGSLAVLDAEDGSLIIQDHRPTDHPHSTVTIDRGNGILLFGSNDGYVYSWGFPDRNRNWKYDTGGDVKAPIPISEGIAVVPSWAGTITGLDVSDGSPQWTFTTDEEVMCAPAIHNGEAYVGSHNGKIYALDLHTGELIWDKIVHEWVAGSAVVTPNHVLVGAYDNHLHALNREDGTTAWKFKGNGEVTSAAAVTDNAIYFTERAEENGDKPGMLYRLTPD